MFNFENLSVYQKAVDFSLLVYKLTQNWPKSELFGITSQLRRCGLSISLNIAEGSGRTKREFVHFLDIARGSTFECVPILTVALKLEYITKQEYQICYASIQEIAKMTNALRTNLNKSLSSKI